MSDKTQTNIITFLFRNIHSGFSIHNVFMPIVHALNASYGEAPSERVDFISIIRNLLWVRKTASQKGINHMTGGPHYFLLAIPLRKNVLTIHDLVLLHNYLLDYHSQKFEFEIQYARRFYQPSILILKRL